MKYVVVSAENPGLLAERINKLLAQDDHMPLGGMAVASLPGGQVLFYQTMLQREPVPDRRPPGMGPRPTGPVPGGMPMGMPPFSPIMTPPGGPAP